MEKDKKIEQKPSESTRYSATTATVASKLFPDNAIDQLENLLENINSFIIDYEKNGQEAEKLKNFARTRERKNDTDVDFRTHSVTLLHVISETQAGNKRWESDPAILKKVYPILSEDITAAKSMDHNEQHLPIYEKALERINHLSAVLKK